MIIINWNCQGLGNQRAVEVLTKLVRSKGPTILFLMETKRTIAEMRNLCHDLNFHSVLAVPCEGRKGGLVMFWKADCNLHIQTFSPNHIDTHILSANQQPWRLIGLYGRLEGYCKHELWLLLQHLHARSSLLWACMSDFNEILQVTEKRGGLPKPLAPMLAFREILLQCKLKDLSYQGYPFTRRNGHSGVAFVEERIDRVCANTKWHELFPSAKIIHQQVSYSDHDPILLYIQLANQQG